MKGAKWVKLVIARPVVEPVNRGHSLGLLARHADSEMIAIAE
jgi:hypothetical protein